MNSRVFQGTVQSYKQGARTMPGEYYTSPAILAEERETIFAQQWNCVGRVSALASAGDYILRDVAGESIIVLRGADGAVRAFFNVCRHRGTRLCTAASGHLSETIQCPYHAWTYATDGRLIGAPHMQDVAGFDKKNYPLHQAAVAESDGFLFVSVARNPAPFAESAGGAMERFARYGLAALKVGHRVTYDVHANWKLVFQNYSECLHCPVIHPELAAILPYQSGANDLIEGPYLGGYMELTPPNESATLTGRACGRLVSPLLGTDDRRRAYYYSLMPNMLLSIQPDYVNYYLLTPVAADRTIVESEWMFAPENDGDPTFNPQDAIAFWDVTNRQDWDIVARSQLGIASRRYEPGPYSPREHSCRVGSRILAHDGQAGNRMNLGVRSFVLAMLFAAVPGLARAQAARDSLCYYTDAPRASRKFALPNGYRLELFRKDSLDVEYACSATVRNARDSVVWTADGFGASLAAWTGRDIDNDGYADAVIGIDTGGGNKCCWGYTVLRLTPKFGVVAELAFTPFFDRDPQGRTLIREFVPFYDLGMTTAESPAVLLVHQIRNGRLQDVTREHCSAILSDTARRIGSLAWDRDNATPRAMAASHRATERSEDVEQTRAAVANIALQYIVCARPKEAEQLVNSTWPSAEAKAEFDSLMSAWAKRAPKRN